MYNIGTSSDRPRGSRGYILLVPVVLVVIVDRGNFAGWVVMWM